MAGLSGTPITSSFSTMLYRRDMDKSLIADEVDNNFELAINSSTVLKIGFDCQGSYSATGPLFSIPLNHLDLWNNSGVPLSSNLKILIKGDIYGGFSSLKEFVTTLTVDGSGVTIANIDTFNEGDDILFDYDDENFILTCSLFNHIVNPSNHVDFFIEFDSFDTIFNDIYDNNILLG